MNRYICIHGHFYQPPRENPWLEEVEQQDEAYPYHDWNERITAECYAPNTASRLLDPEGRIVDIFNNYSSISYNFGPNLLSWMERHNPDVYQSILRADKESMHRFSGHGSALAQVYNHMIMPLANSRDKRTQIIWGIRDFEHRFGRSPEGMWLAETAVDLETLDIMAEYGIAFTILAPHQARRIRTTGGSEWEDVSGQKIDTRRPYLCRLPSGKSIALFFYEGPISLDVSFHRLLDNGEEFAKKLLGAFSDDREPQLVSIATDGETYGHHHRYGEMALTYCLNYLRSNNLAEITVFGEYLERFPPDHDVEIRENTSWSCSHGIERWRADCGCRTGGPDDWSQQWRKPLREAMDWLRDTFVPLYERGISASVHDPWRIRDDYIHVILDRSPENVASFLSRHAVSSLSGEDTIAILKSLELQRHTMLMYTSCGWFFNDISGIETVQILCYAANALQTAKELCGMDFEPNYTRILQRAPCNEAALQNGAQVYDRFVRPAVTDLARVGAHYAVSSLFENYPEEVSLFCYTAKNRLYELKDAGIQRLAVGKALITSHITREEQAVSFAILHLGDHNIIGGIHSYMDDSRFEDMRAEIDTAFMKSDIPNVIHLIEKHYGKNNYSLWHLFRDEQRKILNRIITSALEEREASFQQAYKQYYPIMQVIKEMSIPLPGPFYTTAEFTINTNLRNQLDSEQPDLDALQTLIDEAKRWSVKIDRTTLDFVATSRVNSLMERLRNSPEDLTRISTINAILLTTRQLSLEPDIWLAQNIYFSIGKKMYSDMQHKARKGSAEALAWVNNFNTLGQHLHVKSFL